MEKINPALQSRFATKEEILSSEYAVINEHLAELNKRFHLNDNTGLNDERFPWSKGLYAAPALYVSRMWEYPFAILAADLKEGMKCADIGSGTTPFTAYLAEKAGEKNVTGFDPNYDVRYNRLSFGIRNDMINGMGFNTDSSDMTQINAPDEGFDRVFCLSVLEHIEEPRVWQKGIFEMVRILKPGGRLIFTIDIGIDYPLVNPLEIIKYSGLTPPGSINLHWPVERFMDLDGRGMDVFGLVLEKSKEPIFTDYQKQKPVSESMANLKHLPPIVDSKQIQIGKDLRRNFGMFRIITKLILGKYKHTGN